MDVSAAPTRSLQSGDDRGTSRSGRPRPDDEEQERGMARSSVDRGAASVQARFFVGMEVEVNGACDPAQLRQAALRDAMRSTDSVPTVPSPSILKWDCLRPMHTDVPVWKAS